MSEEIKEVKASGKQVSNEALNVKLTIRDDISQAELEKFEDEYSQSAGMTPSSHGRAMVETAIKAGWIEIDGNQELDPANVLDWDPRVVLFIGGEIAKLYIGLVSIPKN